MDSERTSDVAPPYVIEDRPMLSRARNDSIKIFHTIEPGEDEPSCLQCCNAPDQCPALSLFPCCGYPSYIVQEMAASRYIYVRENSLEWNDPWFQAANGDCCGTACCELAVTDHVRVLYYDDMMFDDIRARKRCWDGVVSAICGGRGEKVEISSRFCCGMCLRRLGGGCCSPVCCPKCCTLGTHRIDIWVDHDAEAMKKIIMEARDNARARYHVAPLRMKEMER
mmetsp:Transcript_19450/g.29972  ORF Transcript_19450/g.29972 Transcript_19450/m.29972 type:complete len:224 (+) Transcript_19450:131-802(+)|eukprot:CAMPEP_0196825884 /NCGR_PEP_ID=MMETSP1362-20130617/93317_1 /TAXON_ID=163516 /ORGANISM="Leptocylindrus danicus, Strain CCMP1856" /LENGTH=223 /DNA_ID=CAMNT_0042206389 /DNA_START=110 /DNA_END=781 /DNA_ORIENTATION=+